MASDHEAGPADNIKRLPASEVPGWGQEWLERERRLNLDQPAGHPGSHAASSDLWHLAGFVEGLGLSLEEVGAVIADVKAQEARELNRSLETALLYVLTRPGGLKAAKDLLRLARLGPAATP